MMCLPILIACLALPLSNAQFEDNTVWDYPPEEIEDAYPDGKYDYPYGPAFAVPYPNYSSYPPPPPLPTDPPIPRLYYTIYSTRESPPFEPPSDRQASPYPNYSSHPPPPPIPIDPFIRSVYPDDLFSPANPPPFVTPPQRPASPYPYGLFSPPNPPPFVTPPRRRASPWSYLLPRNNSLRVSKRPVYGSRTNSSLRLSNKNRCSKNRTRSSLPDRKVKKDYFISAVVLPQYETLDEVIYSPLPKQPQVIPEYVIDLDGYGNYYRIPGVKVKLADAGYQNSFRRGLNLPRKLLKIAGGYNGNNRGTFSLPRLLDTLSRKAAQKNGKLKVSSWPIIKHAVANAAYQDAYRQAYSIPPPEDEGK